MSKEIDPKIKSKINKLLALATSPNKNEAKIAMRRAMSLMQQHGICESELGECKVGDYTYQSGFVKLPQWCLTLANLVGRALGLYVVYQQGRGSYKAKIFFVGEVGTCERAEYLYVSAYRQIEKMSQEYRGRNPGCGVKDTNDYKRGVAISFAENVKEVYGDMEEELAAAIGTEMIALDTRSLVAEDWYKKNVGDVTTNKTQHRNSWALHHGIEDGKDTVVTEGVKGNTDKTKMIG